MSTLELDPRDVGMVQVSMRAYRKDLMRKREQGRRRFGAEYISGPADERIELLDSLIADFKKLRGGCDVTDEISESVQVPEAASQ